MLKVFSIYDCKASVYMKPFYAVNRAVALRDFMHAAQEQGSQLNVHAADFTLFELGEFDESSGELTFAVPKISLGTAIEFLGQEGAPEVDVPHLVNAVGTKGIGKAIGGKK